MLADVQIGWPAAAVILVPLVINALVNTWTGIRADKNARLAAVEAVAAKVEVKKVADTLEATTSETKVELASIKKTGEDNHTLSNSATGANLETIALLMRERAERKDATDSQRADADAADRRLADHVKKQAIVDAAAQEPKGPQKVIVEGLAPPALAAVQNLLNPNLADPLPGDPRSPEKHA